MIILSFQPADPRRNAPARTPGRTKFSSQASEFDLVTSHSPPCLQLRQPLDVLLRAGQALRPESVKTRGHGREHVDLKLKAG